MDLKDRLGEVGARPPAASDPRIDGLVPTLVLEPEDDDACARALSLCHQESMAVIPVGGGTRLDVGNVPSRLDVYLKTARLSGVEDHIPGDLTVAVRAGTTLAALQTELGKARQFLPLEVPRPSDATLGGIFALGEPGLRRRPGARPRDLLLGFEGVLADGTRVRAGGRVVKNVAGHDLMKLFVGSAGTLFVMTRAFLRLRGVPENVTTLALGFRRASAAEAAWRELRSLATAPEIATLLNPEAAFKHELDNWALLLRFEGLDEEVRGAVASVRQLGDSVVVSSSIWDGVRDFPLEGPLEEPLLLRGMAAPARTFQLAESWQDGGELIAYPDLGIVYTRTQDRDALSDRQEAAKLHGAGVVIERAPTELKREVDVFGEVPGGFELMTRIKEKLDPKNILSPGRFVGRL